MVGQQAEVVFGLVVGVVVFIVVVALGLIALGILARRKAVTPRASSEGVDFVLMPCICGAPEASYAVDCPRCDDTGFVEVVA